VSAIPCKNIWHNNPGLMLKCPHCGMSQSELSKQPKPEQPRPAARGVPDVRVSFKLFRGPLETADTTIKEVNAWLGNIAGDARTEIVNSEVKITDKEIFLLIATRTMF
jgi:hypothetical protein